MRYRTRGGFDLEIGRLERQRIDRFILTNPPPEPPTVTLEAWGGIEEEVPDKDDPGYRKALNDWYCQFALEEAELVAKVVEITSGPVDEEREALESIGFDVSPGAFLGHILSDPADMSEVVELCFYQSTVTERGIKEAAIAFDVTWAGKPVLDYVLPSAPGSQGFIFEAQMAAWKSGYKWGEFCDLPGPEQSRVVAFHRIRRRFEWLRQNR